MIKKFAAVSTVLITLSLTTCVSSASVAEVYGPPLQFNIIPQEESDLLNQIETDANHKKMESVLKELKSYEGKTPYVFSGSSPRWGWDCSGLVLWTYEQFGITLQHSATKQAHSGKRVSYKNAKPGDIVTFSYGSDYWFYHAAIYLGNGIIIDANREYGTTVIQPLKNFSNSEIRFIRILETN